jgi:putative sterol carrier protein
VLTRSPFFYSFGIGDALPIHREDGAQPAARNPSGRCVRYRPTDKTGGINMSDLLAYLGPSWRDEALQRLQTELPPEKMNNVTTSMSNIYKNCPGGEEKFLFIECREGKVTRVDTGSGEPPQAEFRIIGDYETFAKISRAELGSQKALMTGKLKLKGNLARALKLAAVADRLNKVLSRIPTQY